MAGNLARLGQKWNREFKLGAYNLVQCSYYFENAVLESLLGKKENSVIKGFAKYASLTL